MGFFPTVSENVTSSMKKMFSKHLKGAVDKALALLKIDDKTSLEDGDSRIRAVILAPVFILSLTSKL